MYGQGHWHWISGHINQINESADSTNGANNRQSTVAALGFLGIHGMSLTYKFVANANPLLQRGGGDDDAVDEGQQSGLVVQGWAGGGTRLLQFVDDNLEAVALLLEIL